MKTKLFRRASVLIFFQHSKNKNSQAILYAENRLHTPDNRIIIRPTHYPQWHIKQISHVCLPFSPRNPHYGQEGDYSLAARINQQHMIYGAYDPIIVDHYSKIWAVQYLQPYEPLRVLPFFDLHIAYNTGAAFSFLHAASGWQNGFLGGLALLISGVLVVWLSRISRKEIWLGIALSLILGGALGNAWDRLLYRYVVDFLSFHLGDWYFAIFNIADTAICVGAFMVFVYWIFPKKDK